MNIMNKRTPLKIWNNSPNCLMLVEVFIIFKKKNIY